MPSQDIYYHRNLPHYHLSGYSLFITFRLVDSLPRNVLAELKTEPESELKKLRIKTSEEHRKAENQYFERFDHWLDRYEYGSRWLQADTIAQIVANVIHQLDGDRFQLIAYCIMPNHVHLLVESLLSKGENHKGRTAKYPITDTLRLLKGRTARSCNLELKRNGAFWQHESYDHVIRDQAELSRTIRYILNNPVKAGMVTKWQDWKYSYVNPKFGER